MSHMSCPRCGLRVRLRAAFLAVEHCPRCLARSRKAVAMLAPETRAWSEQTTGTAAGFPPGQNRAAA